jgi:hypothetical protein
MIAYLPSISKLTIFKWKRPNEFQFRASLTSHLPDWMKNPEKEIFITNSKTTKMRQVYAKVAVVFLSGTLWLFPSAQAQVTDTTKTDSKTVSTSELLKTPMTVPIISSFSP